VTIVLRTSVPPATLARPAAATIRALDPEQPVQDVRTMRDVIDGRLTAERFSALLLASMGIYDVLSYIVRGRSREIGLRTAFGARTADVLRLVIAEGMPPTLLGIAAGVTGALASRGCWRRWCSASARRTR
jgi:ABC-type antimicrobial peptide transport system permease subunit